MGATLNLQALNHWKFNRNPARAIPFVGIVLQVLVSKDRGEYNSSTEDPNPRGKLPYDNFLNKHVQQKPCAPPTVRCAFLKDHFKCQTVVGVNPVSIQHQPCGPQKFHHESTGSSKSSCGIRQSAATLTCGALYGHVHVLVHTP